MRMDLKKTDWRVLLGLTGLTAGFFLPLFAGWGKIFFDDIAFLFYPQQVFLSRCLGEGIIPWWDPHICAGATPFYTRLFACYLYPLNWFFILMERAICPRSFLWLVKAPLVLHYLMAAVFSFYFARRGMVLTVAGSFVLAIAYTFSPTMIYMSTFPPEVFIQAWLPIFCLSLLVYFREGRFSWLIGGSISFAFASAAGDVPFVFHVVFITGLFAFGLIIMALVNRDWRGVARVIVGGVIIFGMGFLMAGVYWSNMIEGLLSASRGTAEEVRLLSGPGQSLYPIYLVTLLIPDFFGGITNHHTWGAAFHINCSLNDAQLSGGIVSCFVIFLGFKMFISRKTRHLIDNYSRSLWWIFSGMLVFSILVVLGAYTPVLGMLRLFIPVLKMPYPIRFRSIQCFAWSGLLGISISTLWRSRENIDIRRAATYLGAVGCIIFMVLLFPYRDGAREFFPGWKHLGALGDWKWFISGPLVYFAAMGALLMIVVLFFRRHLIIRLIAVLIIVELIFFASGAFYHNRVLNRRNRGFSADRYHGPNDHRIYRTFREWGRRIGGGGDRFRSLYERSYFDNLAWIDGSLSMLGFDIKPLDPRFQSILKEVTDGFPYEIRVMDWRSRFWPNMSVKNVISAGPISLSLLRRIGIVDRYHIYSMTSALPRVYFQNRWVSAGDDAQKEALLEEDLRLHGFCDEWIRKTCIDVRDHKFPMDDDGFQLFNQLQATDRILSSDFSNPNRVILDVDIAQPAMLVMTDLWHNNWNVTVNGEPRPLYRVNYLQRGVWCRPGKYRVIMEFRPASLKRGLFMTAVGIIGLIILIIACRMKRRVNLITRSGSL